MKKYLFGLLAVVGLVGFSACNDEPDGPTPGPEGGATVEMEVAMNEAKTAIEMTLTVSDNASYCGYVMSSTEINPTASALINNKVEGQSLVKVADVAENGVIKVVFDRIVAGNIYYFYAVVNDVNGNISEVASESLQTTDEVAPTLLHSEGNVYEAARNGRSATFPFSETVVYNGKAVSYKVLETKYTDGTLESFTEKFSGEFAETSIAVSGSRVTLTLPESVVFDTENYSYTVLVNFAAGAFADNAGNEMAAVTSSFDEGLVEGACWVVPQNNNSNQGGELKEGDYIWLYDSALAEEQLGEQPGYPGYIGGEVSLRACTPEQFEGMDGVMYSVDYLLDGLISIVYDFPQENLYATPVASNADGTFSVLSGSLMASGLELNNGGTGSIGLFVCSLEGDQFYLESKNMVFNPDAESSGIYLYYPESQNTLFVYFLIDEATEKMLGYMDMGSWVEFGEASNYQTSAAYGVKTPSALKRKLSISDFKTDGLDRFPKQLPALKKFKPQSVR